MKRFLILLLFVANLLFSFGKDLGVSINPLRKFCEEMITNPVKLKDILVDTNIVDKSDCLYLKKSSFYDDFKKHIDLGKFNNNFIESDEITPILVNKELKFIKYEIYIKDKITEKICIFRFRYDYSTELWKLREILLDYPYNLFHGDEH